MPEAFDLLDRLVRRNPLLPRAAWLRGLLRGPYHRLMDLQKRGLPLVIGGAMPVRLPAAFCAKELEQYEGYWRATWYPRTHFSKVVALAPWHLEFRVRADGFSKMRAMPLPARTRGGSGMDARSSTRSSSPADRSSTSRK